MPNFHKPRLLDAALLLVFVFSAFVDMYNAYVQHLAGGETVLQNLYKGGLFALLLLLLAAREKIDKRVCLVFALLAFYLLSMFYWRFAGGRISGELAGAVKTFYPYVALVFLLSGKKYFSHEKVINCALLYAAIYIVSLPASILLGFGRASYRGKAFGIVGLVPGANEFGLMMLMTNCLSCYMFFHAAKARYAVLSLLVSAMTVLLGTVTGVIGSFGVLFCLALSRIFIKTKGLRRWQKNYLNLLALLFLPLAGFAIYGIIQFSDFSREKFSAARLLAGGARDWLKTAAFKNFKSFTPADFIFGKGKFAFQARNAEILGFSDPRTIEIDQYDIIGAYGFLFGGLLLLTPVFFFVKIFRQYLKGRKPFYYWASIALALFLIHGFTAGHAFSVITTMQMVMVIIFCHYRLRMQSHG
jgi:hypothetical protein